MRTSVSIAVVLIGPHKLKANILFRQSRSVLRQGFNWIFAVQENSGIKQISEVRAYANRGVRKHKIIFLRFCSQNRRNFLPSPTSAGASDEADCCRCYASRSAVGCCRDNRRYARAHYIRLYGDATGSVRRSL